MAKNGKTALSKRKEIPPPPSESGPQAKKRAFSWPKADPVVFNDILEGLRAVVAKVELSQSLKNLLKGFLYREYRMSEEVQLSRFTSTFLEGFDVDKETLEALSICEAFDEVFKTDTFDFEPNEPLIYAMTVRAVLDIEKLDRDVIRKEPQGFRALLTGIKGLLDSLNDIDDGDYSHMIALMQIAEGMEWWCSGEWEMGVAGRIEGLLTEIDKMKPHKARIKQETDK